jgi:hypothetical protein
MAGRACAADRHVIAIAGTQLEIQPPAWILEQAGHRQFSGGR